VLVKTPVIRPKISTTHRDQSWQYYANIICFIVQNDIIMAAYWLCYTLVQCAGMRGYLGMLKACKNVKSERRSQPWQVASVSRQAARWQHKRPSYTNETSAVSEISLAKWTPWHGPELGTKAKTKEEEQAINSERVSEPASEVCRRRRQRTAINELSTNASWLLTPVLRV